MGEVFAERRSQRCYVTALSAAGASLELLIDCVLFFPTVPQRADREMVETIEQLVNSIVSGTLSAKERNAQKNCPEYW